MNLIHEIVTLISKKGSNICLLWKWLHCLNFFLLNNGEQIRCISVLYHIGLSCMYNGHTVFSPCDYNSKDFRNSLHYDIFHRQKWSHPTPHQGHIEMKSPRGLFGYTFKPILTRHDPRWKRLRDQLYLQLPRETWCVLKCNCMAIFCNFI